MWQNESRNADKKAAKAGKGDAKASKPEAPPAPPPKATYHLCGTSELEICAVVAAYNLLVSSLPSPPPFKLIPLKSEPAVKALQARAPKGCGVMMTDGALRDGVPSGTAVLGLRQCLSALSPPLPSPVETCLVSSWMGWCETTLVPALGSPEKLEM